MTKKEEYELCMQDAYKKLEGQCNRCGECESHQEGECPGNSINCCDGCSGAEYCIYEITDGILGSDPALDFYELDEIFDYIGISGDSE